MDIENKAPVAIEDEMRNSYIDYAMSVIVWARIAGCSGRSQTGSIAG